jgi:hypothetical protein
MKRSMVDRHRRNHVDADADREGDLGFVAHVVVHGRAAVSPAVRAMIHAAHAHVLHGEGGALAERRDGRDHAEARRQGCPGHAGAVDAFRDESIGAVLGRRDDDVVGLGIADLEFFDGDRAHILAVGLDYGH